MNRWYSQLRRVDYFLTLPLVLLMIFSTLVISSGNQALAQDYLGFVLLALFLFITLGSIDYQWLRRITWPLLIFLVLLLVAVLVLGTEVRGSTRWLDLGPFRFQPSEFAKIIFIVVVAGVLDRISPQLMRLKHLVLLGLMVIIPTFLVFKQPDFGTAIIFFAIGSSLIFSAGLPWRVFFISVLGGLLSMPLLWKLMHGYQRERLLVFLNPERDALGTGYNVIQALIAVGSGQIMGRGYGRGPQSQLRFLPEQHTDFIFATLAEEWGLLGVTLLLILLFLLILRVLLIARQSKDAFGAYLCLGVAYLLMTQVLINIGMNIGIMPVTGLPLPFVSYGGSALLAYTLALSLVHSVALHSRA